MRDLHELPRISDSLSFLYLEHCKVEQEGLAIASLDTSGKTPIPCAASSVLMLGPGTSITHAAVKALADNGCTVVWCGEQAIRFYGLGLGETRSSRNLERQALLWGRPHSRLTVVRRMYQMRFNERLPEDLTLKQIRGREGVRVREAYAKASRETGVEWNGRSYSRGDWHSADPVNKALSCANACLYGVCHAAIVSAGFSPGLGFIHTGKQLSFVYDIADLYKTETIIPVAFQTARESCGDIERVTRTLCRDTFHEVRLLERIVDDLDALMKLEEEYKVSDDVFNTEPALPGQLWDPDGNPVSGGINHGDN